MKNALTPLRALLLAAGVALFGRLAVLPAPSVEIAGYATTLSGRTPNQRHNARLAASALNNKVIAPGAVFSFNRAAGSWSVDQGYRKAPVSYDGELVPAFGGGVCQTSTTLYNAALLAGLGVVERHRHVFAPHYVSPGRDAAVAYPNIDLRLRNPHPFPVRITARASGDRLDVRLWGRQKPAGFVQIMPQILTTTTPLRLTRRAGEKEEAAAYGRSPGATGYRVVTFRVFHEKGRATRRERLGDDTYPAMNRIVQLAASEDERAAAAP